MTSLVTPELEALAEASGDEGAARRDEPYRRAITGIYARLAATYARLSGRAPPRPAKNAAEAYENADALLADLNVIQNALAANGDGGLGRGGAVGGGLGSDITGTYNVLEACRKAGVKRVVYASSIHAVGFCPVA